MPSKLNCSFITGLAGTGKSTGLKSRLAMDPSAYVLTSTTGISAINLGITTLNSVLKFYDTDSLMDSYVRGQLYGVIKRLVSGPGAVHGLAIDEVSMMDASQLDMIHDTMERVAQHEEITQPLELVLCGDFLQLAPIKARFAFEAECWPEFEANTIKLDTVYRQDNLLFLEALNEFRAGNGKSGVSILKDCGVKFNTGLVNFKGTTIIPTNQAVDSFNKIKFANEPGTIIKIPTIRLGQQSSDWKDPKIPDNLELKLGCLVMILANDTIYKTYANGDQGIVEQIGEDGKIRVRIVANGSSRDGQQVWVSRVKRESWDHMKDEFTGERRAVKDVIGSVDYMPMRLGYCSTVHKCQGLTLDNVQIDFRDKFFGNPGMMYVALSRCRTPEGLRLVGSEELMIKRTVLNKKVERFL